MSKTKTPIEKLQDIGFDVPGFDDWEFKHDGPLVVPYGAGTNSTALLVGLIEKGIKPDLVIFADTGNEKPNTYEHIKAVHTWLVGQGYPGIAVVRHANRQGEELTLEQDVMRLQTLPAYAFGFKTCSQKFKIQPQNKFLNSWDVATAAWDEGKTVARTIGYDAGEWRRVKHANSVSGKDAHKFTNYFPLAAWGWSREDCQAAILRAGLELPGKSACFFCPAMKKHEILQLREDYPDLFDRAIDMEQRALAGPKVKSTKGLGRYFSWKEFVEASDEEKDKFIEAEAEPCGCFDGD